MGIVYGVGIRESGEYAVSNNGKHTTVYTLWKNMLARCYSKVSLKNRPTYIGCEVSGDFLYFQKFAHWYSSQPKAEGVEYQVDKDLLVKGNKIYSENYCVLVPRKVNMFLCKSNSVRGQWPIGVSFDKRSEKFIAQMHNREIGYLGSYTNPTSAYLAYKSAKELAAKKLARDYQGRCDERVIEALLAYTVEITD